MNKTITIAADSIKRAEAAIAGHNKKIEKINRRHALTLALATMKVLGTRVANVTGPGGREQKVMLAEVEITGEAAVIAGWEICAVISAVDDAQTPYAISRVHGASIEDVAPFAARGGSCDHCKAARRRNTTYLVKAVAGRADEAGNTISEAGEIKVVGSTCVADFTGHKSPAGLVAYADMMSGFEAELDGLEEEAEDIVEGRTAAPVSRASVINLALFLAYVRAAIRTLGWVSRGQAYDTGAKATANVAFESLEAVQAAERFMDSDVPERDGVTGDLAPELARAKDAIKPTDKDTADAAADIALVEERLESKAGNWDDFETNVGLVVRQGYVFWKSLGVAAAICRMADRIREENRARAQAATLKNEHFGTVDERLNFRLEVVSSKPITSRFGHSTLYTARDAEGRQLKWFDKSNHTLEAGLYEVRATVKEHGEFRGVKETVLNRVDIVRKVVRETAKMMRDRLAGVAKPSADEAALLGDVSELLAAGLPETTDMLDLAEKMKRLLASMAPKSER